jgi:hypothetical protein
VAPDGERDAAGQDAPPSRLHSGRFDARG